MAQGRFFQIACKRWHETLGISWLRTYPPLLTLPAGTELANCTETAMFYDRVLN